MSRILVLLLIVCLPVVAQAQDASTENEDGGNIVEDDVALIISILRDLESVLDYYSRQAAQNNYPDQSVQIAAQDIDIQERMSAATEDMALYAAFALGLTVIGLLMLWRTLYHTKKAARASEDTLAEFRKNAQIELRAYLSIDKLVLNHFEEDIDTDGIWSLTDAVITNNGQTPAHDVVIKTAIHQRHEIPKSLHDYSSARTKVTEVGTIGGSSPHPVCMEAVGWDSLDPYICGTITYKDVFGATRETFFCFHYDCQDIGSEMTRNSEGNYST